MRPLIISGINPLNEVDWTILRVEKDMIDLAMIDLATTEDNLNFNSVVSIQLSKENICQLRDYLTELLDYEHAERYHLVDKNGKYLNIDSTEYIGFGEKESRYKNTFTEWEIKEYNLSHWIENGNVKKILVENTDNELRKFIHSPSI